MNTGGTALLLLAVISLIGCALLDRPDDCLPVDATPQHVEALNSAAQGIGGPPIGGSRLSLCRRRGDGSLQALWEVAHFDATDSVRQWDDVSCWLPEKSGSGWTCTMSRLRKLQLAMPDSSHYAAVVLPPDFSASEGRRLATHGLDQWPSLNAANACDARPNSRSDLAKFRKYAPQDGEWTLQREPSSGRLRLVHDTLYHIDFDDPGNASARPTCWGIFEMLY